METQNVESAARRVVVAIGLAGIAAVHLLDLPGKWSETRYLGVGYVVVIAASHFLLDRILVRGSRLDFAAAGTLAASVIAGFVINRTLGMPGARDDIGNWLEPLGLFSLFIEAFVVWQSVRAMYSSRTQGIIRNDFNREPIAQMPMLH